jgi:UDP-N-acetylglucosamine diphosphorylase / glucose-1-phosphate thymidylyltransferase / UDP-N-acetylgalactosamine diphosphorylase / glucosamine-1-phosphate N-acetyltransferase / galactosamine-1-phosphate N-acetyltransferase
MSTPPLVVYDDARARALEPFALTRPAGELRAGAEVVRRRWERVARARASAFAGARHLATFEEFDAPGAVTGVLPRGAIVVSSRCAPALDERIGDASLWRCEGRVAAVRLAAPLDVEHLADGSLSLESLADGGAADIRGWWIDDVWDLVRHLSAMLTSDIAVLGPEEGEDPPAGLTVLGEHPAFVARGAFIEPLTLADTTGGPVLVRSGARVSAFTRLVGPCVIGAHAIVAGGKVTGCSIGEHARVHGELSASIVIGHANKAHDGFVGHSVIGRWANLGAGTITSNLKNNYGEVSLWTPRGMQRTGLQFLGAFIGDHAKTGIGTRLTTGCVVGAGANIFGSAMPPKVVPPFAWGDAPPFARFEREKFIEVAERVMQRREVTLTAGERRTLEAAWARGLEFVP